jgi:hypothetical protein
MGIMHRLGHGFHITGSSIGLHGLVPHQFCQPGALDVFHRKIVLPFRLAHVIDRNNVRMMQRGDRFGLHLEALYKFRAREAAVQDHLHGHGSVQTYLARFINHAHAAARNLLEKFVITQPAVLAVGEGTVPTRASVGWAEAQFAQAFAAEPTQSFVQQGCPAGWAGMLKSHYFGGGVHWDKKKFPGPITKFPKMLSSTQGLEKVSQLFLDLQRRANRLSDFSPHQLTITLAKSVYGHRH